MGSRLLGLYFWLRMKAFYNSAAPFLLAAVVLVRRSYAGPLSADEASLPTSMTPLSGRRTIAESVGTLPNRAL